MTSMSYDVIFIDWDGTLSRSRFWEQWANDPIRKKDNQLIQERFFQTTPEMLETWMRGALNTEAIVEEIARRTGLEAKVLLSGLQESCKQMKLLDSTALDLIVKVRKQGMKVVIATDNMDTFTRWTVPALQLHHYFDDILNSHFLKALKKDKKEDGTSAFFGGYLQKYSIEPGRSVLIDDSSRNVVVEEFGMGYVKVGQDVTVTSILGELLRN